MQPLAPQAIRLAGLQAAPGAGSAIARILFSPGSAHFTEAAMVRSGNHPLGRRGRVCARRCSVSSVRPTGVSQDPGGPTIACARWKPATFRRSWKRKPGRPGSQQIAGFAGNVTQSRYLYAKLSGDVIELKSGNDVHDHLEIALCRPYFDERVRATIRPSHRELKVKKKIIQDDRNDHRV